MKKSKPAVKPDTVLVTLELIKDRAIYAKALAFLKGVRKNKAAVSLWGAMSQLQLKQPWDENPRKELVIEAAKKLGMRIYEENGMVMVK